LEQLAEARHVAVAAAFYDFVEAQLRGFEQRLGAFDTQMLDVAERRRPEVRAEMPQQAALAGAAVRGESRHADLVLQFPVEEVGDLLRQRMARFLQQGL